MECSERTLVEDGYHFFCLGMCEGDALGMKKQACGMCAVEVVANDGHSQTVGMGAVDAKLVGAAGEGEKVKAGGCGAHLAHDIACDALFTAIVVNFLARTVEVVGREREAYLALVARMQGAAAVTVMLHDSDVTLPYLMRCEHTLKRALHRLALCEDKNAGCLHVETVGGVEQGRRKGCGVCACLCFPMGRVTALGILQGCGNVAVRQLHSEYVGG